MRIDYWPFTLTALCSAHVHHVAWSQTGESKAEPYSVFGTEIFWEEVYTFDLVMFVKKTSEYLSGLRWQQHSSAIQLKPVIVYNVSSQPDDDLAKNDQTSISFRTQTKNKTQESCFERNQKDS